MPYKFCLGFVLASTEIFPSPPFDLTPLPHENSTEKPLPIVYGICVLNPCIIWLTKYLICSIKPSIPVAFIIITHHNLIVSTS